MTFKVGQHVIVAQLDMFDKAYAGSKGIIVNPAARNSSKFCEVLLHGAGKHIIDSCALEPISEIQNGKNEG